MFLSKDWFKVVRIDCGIASIFPFRVDVPSSSESVQFGTKMTKTEPDNKVELREVFGPSCLPSGQHLDNIRLFHNLVTSKK